MTMNYTTSYAQIVKYDTNDDGTLMVYGKATDDTLDLDAQICDAAWLDEAMPAWFKSGGNIREMHGPSAAGIAKEYESKKDGHYIGVHVVDPIAAKKVETGVYQGFSIGIKSPRVVRDNKAANGRIIDGQIIEVSLVDRPANPSAKLILAKSVEGESSLVQVEELHEYKAPLPSDIAKHGDHDQSDHAPSGGGGGGSSKDGSREPSGDTQKNIGNLGHDLMGVANDINDAASDDKSIRSASVQVSSAMDHIGDAEAAKTADEARSALDQAGRNLSNAVATLEANNYNQEASDVYDMQKQVESASQAIKNGTWKSLTLKHGDHDQSDHSPTGGGGGGSDKPSGDDKPSEESSDSNRDNEVARINEGRADEVRVGLNDVRDAILDVDEDKAQDAAASVKEAQELVDSAMNSLDDARNATDGSHAASVEDAIKDLGVAEDKINDAFSALSEVEYDMEDQEDELADMRDEVTEIMADLEEYLDGLYGRDKSAITKHGDHDQSDHAPSGGGGSDKPSSDDKPSGDDKPADVPSESGFNETDQQAINDTIMGNEDISMGIDNLYDEDHDDYIEDLSEQDEDMTAEAKDSIKEANEQLERAYFAKDNDTRAAALDSALVRMDEAASSLRNADSRILASFADDLDARMEEISAVYDAILEGDDSPIKSATTTKEPKMARQRRAAKSAINKEEGMPMNGESKSIPSREEMIERYAAARKAVDTIAAEAKSHGYDDIEKAYGETAEEETAEGPAVAAETAEEEVREAEEQKPADEAKAVDADDEKEDEDKEKKKVSEDDESEDDEVVKSLIEKAVKSAMDSVKVEIDTLLAEKKSAVEKSVKLESDLATALSKSVAGGPKRTATKMSDAAQNDLLVKAATYKAKADATTDPVLAKGYRELANDFFAKAAPKPKN